MTESTLPIRTLSAFERVGRRGMARRWARSLAIGALSPFRSLTRTKGWVRFPYYHHVFDDERAGFARQIDVFKSVGDIIGLDDAIAMIAGGIPIDGRYFCLTFDDGFKNWIENALPILIEKDAVAAFFVATDFIGTDPVVDRDRLLGFYADGKRLMAFMDWDDCRTLAENGMVVGSHAMSHRRLSMLSEQEARTEMIGSKERIEAALGRPCRHFCAPFGIPGHDFDPEVHPKMAADVGYASFMTTRRGANRNGTSAHEVRRDHMMANAPLQEVRYFLGDGLGRSSA